MKQLTDDEIREIVLSIAADTDTNMTIAEVANTGALLRLVNRAVERMEKGAERNEYRRKIRVIKRYYERLM